jgi:hypothetical protein
MFALKIFFPTRRFVNEMQLCKSNILAAAKHIKIKQAPSERYIFITNVPFPMELVYV